MDKSDVICLIEEKVNPIDNKKLEKDTFFWIIGTLMVIIIGCLGILYGKQSTLETTQNENNIKIITQLAKLETSSQSTGQDIQDLKQSVKELNKYLTNFEIRYEE